MKKIILAGVIAVVFFALGAVSFAQQTQSSTQSTSSTKNTSAQQSKIEKEILARVKKLIELINQEPNLLAVNPKAKVVKPPDWTPYTPDGRRNQDFKVVPDDSSPEIAQALQIEQNRQKWSKELVGYGTIAVPELIKAVLDEGNKYRHFLVWALGEIKDLRAVPCILKYYDEALSQERLAKSLEKMGLKDQPAQLRKEAELKKKYAIEALKKISGKDFGDNYSKWEQWWKEVGSKLPGAKLPKLYEVKGAKPPAYGKNFSPNTSPSEK